MYLQPVVKNGITTLPYQLVFLAGFLVEPSTTVGIWGFASLFEAPGSGESLDASSAESDGCHVEYRGGPDGGGGMRVGFSSVMKSSFQIVFFVDFWL